MRIEVENAENIKVQHPEDTYEIIRKIFYDRHDEVDLMKEHFWTIALNKALKILAIELVSIGCKDKTIADPGDVFRVPLYKSSSAVVLVHSHPSGDLQPSEADLELTNRLMKAGDILDIKIIDHVIVTKHSFYSLRESGHIEKLKWDTTYALSFIYEKKVSKRMEQLKAEVEKERKKGKREGLKEGKQEGEKIGLEKGAKKEKVEIARNLLSQGIDPKPLTDPRMTLSCHGALLIPVGGLLDLSVHLPLNQFHPVLTPASAVSNLDSWDKWVPSLHPHYKGFITTTNPSAPAYGIGIWPRGFSTCAVPLVHLNRFRSGDFPLSTRIHMQVLKFHVIA